jgi:kinetochore protein Nuf2
LTNNLLVYHLCVHHRVFILTNSFCSVFFSSTRFAKAARVEDFNAKDVFSPDRERTLILLSAFINFVKFTEQYCNAFVKELRSRSDAIIVERDQVSEQLSEIRRSIDGMKYASYQATMV